MSSIIQSEYAQQTILTPPMAHTNYNMLSITESKNQSYSFSTILEPMQDPTFNISLDQTTNSITQASSIGSPIKTFKRKNILPLLLDKDLNKAYLKELPKILPKDFAGKDLCIKCLKIVKNNHQAVSCSECERWTHRKCCGMKVKKYEMLTKEKTFTWYCLNCRVDDPDIDSSQYEHALKLLPDDFEAIIKEKNDFIIAHINCRSVVNKEEELQIFIDNLNPDILCLTETWMDESVPKGSHIPTGYKIIRKDRTELFHQKYKVNKGGGIAILYKAHLNVTMRKNLNDETEDILWAHVGTKNSFLLGVLYRPKYSEILNEEEGNSILEESLQKATEITNRIIITGDLNVNTDDPENTETETLNDIMSTYNLKQKITKYTRIDPDKMKGTIIDHFWITPNLTVKTASTCPGISDHLGIYLKMPKSDSSTFFVPKVKFRNFKNYDKGKFAQDFKENLENSKMELLLKQKEVNEATKLLVKIIQETASIHAPLVIKKKKTKKAEMPWITDELRNKIKEKNLLLKDYYNSNITGLKKRANAAQNSIKTIKWKKKKTYIRKQFNEAGTDPVKIWRLYKFLTGRMKDNEDTEPDFMTQTKADEFNKYFTNVGKSPHQIPIPVAQTPRTKEKFSFKPENAEKIEKLIDKLKENTAIGNDDIGAKLIKDIKKELSPTLTKIINLGYITNTFPDIMKSAIIKPIYKEDDTNNFKNYRPIAILPTLSKLFERAATNQLTEFLEENKILSPLQHAYRKNHSTITCLAEALNYIYTQLDKKKHTAIALLDLSKAFDSINHELLLRKLITLGLQNTSIEWINSYLTNRTQCTKLRQYTSSYENTTTGVPQGSILGPLLFICYTNDFPDTINEICKTLCYADDTQLLISADTEEDLKAKTKKAIEAAQSWFKENSLKINTDKTKILMFDTNKDPETLQIQVNDGQLTHTLKPKPHLKVLGIYIDKDLNWKKQINIVKKNSMNVVRNVHRLNRFLSLKHRINIYNGIISPLFDYGDILWGGCNKNDAKRLQTVQNFAVKSITGNKKYDSASDSFNQLQFLKLEDRRKIHESVFIHKILLNVSTPNLHQELSKYFPQVTTRNKTKKRLIAPAHKTSKFEKSPLHRMITTWNQTPYNLPKDNIRTHKIHYQKHLIATKYLSSKAA